MNASTTTTGSASGLTFGLPTTFTATVKAGSLTPTGQVDFYDTTTQVDLGQGTLSGSGVATFTTVTPLEAGAQTITLSYLGAAGFATSSSTVSINVLASIYVLNATASGALSLSGSASVNVPGLVQVDSSSASSIQLSGSTRVTASKVGIVGGTSVTGSSGFSVTPTKGASIADPFANLPIPSATGMPTYAAVNLGGVTKQTISPGIYPSISVGASGQLTMLPGIYVIKGGGFSVSGAGIVTGSGVFIYNAGSNYNGGSGSSFGAISLSAGTVTLSPPTTGVYAGISIFQSRDNTKAMTVSGALFANLGGGVIYAPSAVLNISGSAQVGGSGTPVSPLIVNELVVSGAAGAFELAAGAGSSYTASTSNWITDTVLTIAAEDDTGAGLDPAKLADLDVALSYLNQSLAAFGVNLSWAPAGTPADLTVHFATTTPEGGAADGVLGFTTAQNDVYFVTGWNFYTGSDPSQIGPDQYDFTTLATHELAHTLGLGESQDPASVMYEYLAPGTVRRTFTDDNLTVIDTDSDRFMKVAETHLSPTATPVPIAPTSPALPASLSLNTRAFDSALAALDPVPDAVSRLASTEVERVDVALEAVAEESYLVPLEIAQDIAGSTLDDASKGPIRKPSSSLA